MGEMKIANKINYEYHYWFAIHFRDRYGVQAERLYQDMTGWMKNALDHTDYSLNWQLLKRVRYSQKYQIDFRTEEAYTFFALCWDSRVDDYLNSYSMKR
jgi:hypothetical protein